MPDEEECKHIKLYDEEFLAAKLDKPIVFKWHCLKCHSEGISDDSIEFVFTYEGLLKIKKSKPYEYKED